jgi:hypothetical protein
MFFLKWGKITKQHFFNTAVHRSRHPILTKILKIKIEKMNQNEIKNRDYTHCTIDCGALGDYTARIEYCEETQGWKPYMVRVNGEWMPMLDFDNSHRGKNYSLKNLRRLAYPKEIRTNHEFMSSVFRNAECEIVLRNIVLLQKKTSPDAWIPFSWEDYKAFCTHDVSEKEHHVLNVFVNGGKSVPSTSTDQSSGWLAFDGENYTFTEQMIDMLSQRYLVDPQST